MIRLIIKKIDSVKFDMIRLIIKKKFYILIDMIQLKILIDIKKNINVLLLN